MTEKYWKDYSEFLSTVKNITTHSPSTLLEFYTDFIESLETVNINNYKQFEYEMDNDFYFRVQIQKILDDKNLLLNELKLEFQDKIVDLDKRIKKYLSEDCLKRNDWYKGIELNPNKFI